jgi:hypothetical protein
MLPPDLDFWRAAPPLWGAVHAVMAAPPERPAAMSPWEPTVSPLFDASGVE